jgi:hypothetical protein
MQNRYVGDIGDYVKLAILRALLPGRRVGVAWWLYPDEGHNRDGRRIEYLDRPDPWRRFDPLLFDALKKIVLAQQRNVHALEQASLMPGAFLEPIPCDVHPFPERARERQRWLDRTNTSLESADLLFVDPDNGIAPLGLKLTRRSAGKSILMAEIVALRRSGRTVVVYHHQTRRKGGHVDELRHLAERLADAGCRVSGALRASPWSPRAFFLIDADTNILQRAQSLSAQWNGLITWHDNFSNPKPVDLLDARL